MPRRGLKGVLLAISATKLDVFQDMPDWNVTLSEGSLEITKITRRTVYGHVSLQFSDGTIVVGKFLAPIESAYFIAPPRKGGKPRP